MSNEQSVKARERVYDFPHGFRREAEDICGWLRHAGLHPEWELGTRENGYCTGILLPLSDVPALRALQRSNPARFGNPPEVEAEMENNRREIAASSALFDERMSKLSKEQQEWVEVLSGETNLPGLQALDLNDTLHDLAAMHFKLCHMDVEQGLDDVQRHARDCIEEALRDSVVGLRGVKGPAFVYDPRGTTVGVKFESGAGNSLLGGGMYKVPLGKGAVKALDRVPFWERFPLPERANEDGGPEPA